MPLVPVTHYPTWQAAQDHALVVIASQSAPSVQLGRGPNGVTLYAPSEIAGRLHRELTAYDRISELPAPDPAAPSPTYGSGAFLTLLWIAGLAAAFIAQTNDPEITELGASSASGLFDRGEWWRPLTALFLHADIFHILSNIASGTLFATLACRAIGAFIAWPLILASATLGNILTALSHHPGYYQSIGASTAVFAALGILTAAGIVTSHHTRGTTAAPWKPVILPLGGGLALLAWFGAGSSPTTDVLAHLLGFASGLVLGIPIAFLLDHFARNPESSGKSRPQAPRPG